MKNFSKINRALVAKKKIFLFMAATAMSIAASATDLWTGSQHVSWADGGLQIEAAKFAAAQPGQKIVVSFAEGATDGIEFKVINKNFDHLAGSRENAWIKDATVFEQFLTQAAVDSLKLYGLELIGANFTVTKVEGVDASTAATVYGAKALTHELETYVGEIPASATATDVIGYIDEKVNASLTWDEV